METLTSPPWVLFLQSFALSVSGTAIYDGKELLAIVQGIGVSQRLSFKDTQWETIARIQPRFTWTSTVFEPASDSISDFSR